MSDHELQLPTLLRAEVAAIPAAERRAASYALRLLRNQNKLRENLEKDGETVEALWQSLRPLFAPEAIGAWLTAAEEQEARRERPSRSRVLRAHLAFDGENDESEDAEDVERPLPWARGARSKPTRHARQAALRHLCLDLPAAELADWLAVCETPVPPVVALLGDALGLTEPECRMLEFLEHYASGDALRQLLRACGDRRAGRLNVERLAPVLDLPSSALRALLRRRASLRTLGLVEYEGGYSDLEDFVQPSSLLRELLEAAPATVDELLALLIEPAPSAVWHLEAFPHLAAALPPLRETLAAAASTGAVGVNALFHGPPGTGKTELARALAAAAGLTAWQVRSADEDEDGLERNGRLAAYLLAQRLLARRRDVALIFDEVEDVFDAGGDLLALFTRRRAAGRQKGWINRILEDNPVPAIWIANRIDALDPAFLRRFLLPLACPNPPRSVRRQMAERHLGDRALTPTLLDELAADPALTPAQLGAARRLLDLRPDAAPEATVRHGVAALRTLLHGAPALRRRLAATTFDVAYLNLAGAIGPSALVRALERTGRGTLCFYGPPGTGKTAFAELLAEALDRELVARTAGELLSPYVGETERNLAALFRETDPTATVLLLDEVDSLLSDRSQARRTWERTQVNELLQQLERYPGIFVAATNLMTGLDPAALRRFDVKLEFRALTPAQRRALFAREALGDAAAPVPERLGRHLDQLDGLTPGDFAVVCRQRALLGETLTPEQFLRRLMAECRVKDAAVRQAA